MFKVIQEEKKISSKTDPKHIHKTRTLGIPSAQWPLVEKFMRFIPSQGRKKSSDVKTKQAVRFPLLPSLQWQSINLDAVNQFLIVLLIGLLAAVVHYAVNRRPDMEAMIETIFNISFKKIEGVPPETFPAVAFYLEQVQTRDIFNPAPEIKEEVIAAPPPPSPPPPPEPQLPKKAKGLKVVGIAWGESPKVMIKDEATQEVYFVQKGDTIGKTGIEVRTILKDKVVVGYQDEEMDLL